MKKGIVVGLVLCLCVNVHAREYHVSPQGSDADAGSFEKPLRTINRAAQLALPHGSFI